MQRSLIPIVSLVVFSFLFSDNLNAQSLDLKPDEKIDKASYLKIETDYLTNNVYYGRADTILTPGILPSLGYYHKSGIYILASGTYLPNKTFQKLDNGSIELGYSFDNPNGIGGSIAYDKLFSAQASTQVKSLVSSSIILNLDYDIAGIVTPTLELDYNINRDRIQGDFLINVGLTHDFLIDPLFGKHDLLIISPTFLRNAGSQNFYQQYLYKKFKSSSSKQQAFKAINNLSKFTLLDYEFSLPVYYTTGKFTFSVIPTLSIAENTLPTVLQAGYIDQISLFYTQFGISFKL
jgi:hypothetical protein